MAARSFRRPAGAGLVLLLVAVVLAAAAPAGPAAAGDPIFVGWSTLLPPTLDAYQPSSADSCAAGKPRCVKRTIADMSKRFEPLADACDHNAVFALAYLRTTETYANVAAEPGFFEDPAFVNHEDAVFAKYYFTAYDAWVAGQRQNVPPAWLIALDAAAAHTDSGSGNLMLGMNAHVNADLPFVLAAVGLVKPDGTSRKPDHDKVNEFLNHVVQPLLEEEAARFDPTMDDTNSPYGITYTVLMQALTGWRETAWRNAERLVNAPDDATREAIARDIQDFAAANAQALQLQYAYLPPLTTSSARDKYCSLNHG